MPRAPCRAAPALVGLGVLAAPPAQGAGGHHAVDDAAILDPGQCQIETWFNRERGGARTLLHAGPACRIGAVELGLNADRARADGNATTPTGAQLKWAREIGGDFSAGIVIAATAQKGAPGYLGSTIVLPLSWQTTDAVVVHANIGRDARHRERDTSHSGIALEWTPASTWSFVGERFREAGSNHWRAGARWFATPALSVDFSRAQGLHRSPAQWWTIGVNWVFER